VDRQPLLPTEGEVSYLYTSKQRGEGKLPNIRPVSHPGKGECADPVDEDAILGGAGGRRPGQNRKRQFNPDTGDGKT
jgi:hypothetical protein